VQEAIEHAEATGDDLNVVPESFHSAAYWTKTARPAAHVPLQPSDAMDGRFAPPELLPGGWYNHPNDSGLDLPDTIPRNPRVPVVPLHPRDSLDSLDSYNTTNHSVYLPRRVESFVSPEDARIYHLNQHAQRPPGGAYFEFDNIDWNGSKNSSEKTSDAERDGMPPIDSTEYIAPAAVYGHAYQAYPYLSQDPSTPPSQAASPSRPPLRRSTSTSTSEMSIRPAGPKALSASATVGGGQRSAEFTSSNNLLMSSSYSPTTAGPSTSNAHETREGISVAANQMTYSTSPLARRSFMRSVENLTSHGARREQEEESPPREREVETDTESPARGSRRRPNKLRRKSRRRPE
jgi:hypothetical protein